MNRVLVVGVILLLGFSALAQGQAPEAGAFGVAAQMDWPFNVWTMESGYTADVYLPYELGFRWHALRFLMVEPKVTFAKIHNEGDDYAYGVGLGIDFWKNLKEGISVYAGPYLSLKRHQYDGDEGTIYSMKIDFGVQYTIAGRLGIFADYGFGMDFAWDDGDNFGSGPVLYSLEGGRLGLVFYL